MSERWEKRDGAWWKGDDGPYTWHQLNIGLGAFGECSLWLDRQGEPIPMLVSEALLTDDDYRVVKQDVFVVDDQPVMVSTVWLGLDMSFGLGGPPKIFETMIFSADAKSVLLNEMQWRWSTEEEALEGHAEACRLVQMTSDAHDN
jgi:hypothetical protein